VAIYRVKVKGREAPVLMRVKNKTEATDAIITEAKALNGEEVEDALAAGAKLWDPTSPLPADDGVPVDVRELVVAAREAWGSDGNAGDALDMALEAFAERVPFAEAE